jgi:translation initiation factor 2B subunit (eIF-2B alpha/beta/delta family)
MQTAEAFLTGADAVGPDAFINKVGTGALAALAGAGGVPTYVLTGREKFVAAEVFASLRDDGGSAAEVWRDAPPGVAVGNPYFEQVPVATVAAFITDVGVIPPGTTVQFA